MIISFHFSILQYKFHVRMCLSTPWKKVLVGLGHEGGARNSSLLLSLVANLFRGEEESVLSSDEEAQLARLFF